MIFDRIWRFFPDPRRPGIGQNSGWSDPGKMPGGFYQVCGP